MKSSFFLRIMSYVLAVLIVILVVVLIITKPFKDIEPEVKDDNVVTGVVDAGNKDNLENKTETTKAPDPTATPQPTATPEPTAEPVAEPTQEPENTAEPDLTYGLVFEEKNDYIEVAGNCNLRKGCSTQTDKVAYLSEPTRMLRTGYNKEWTRVVYNGIVCYISTPLIAAVMDRIDATPTPAPTATPTPVIPEDPTYGLSFEDKNDYVDTKAGINLRSGCSTETAKVAYLEEAVRLHRTGVSDTWTRVEYNGTVCYVSNALIVRVVESMDTVVEE